MKLNIPNFFTYKVKLMTLMPTLISHSRKVKAPWSRPSATSWARPPCIALSLKFCLEKLIWHQFIENKRNNLIRFLIYCSIFINKIYDANYVKWLAFWAETYQFVSFWVWCHLAYKLHTLAIHFLKNCRSTIYIYYDRTNILVLESLNLS